MMIHGSMIWNFVNSMPQVYRGSPLVFTNKWFGNCQNCHFNRSVTITGFTVSGKACYGILFKCQTIEANCNTETQIEMRDGTVEHFPGLRGPRRGGARGAQAWDRRWPRWGRRPREEWGIRRRPRGEWGGLWPRRGWGSAGGSRGRGSDRPLGVRSPRRGRCSCEGGLSPRPPGTRGWSRRCT